MPIVNCRNHNACIFCKNWVGREPKVNYITGLSSFGVEKGLCRLDDTDKKYKATDLCRKFQRQLTYM